MESIDQIFEAGSFRYYSNCVSWPQDDVNSEGGLVDMISAGQHISRQTFLRNVDAAQLKEMEDQLGYGSWLKMKNDPHVSYERSVLHGRVVYFFNHSAIEYVFTPDGGPGTDVQDR